MSHRSSGLAKTILQGTVEGGRRHKRLLDRGSVEVVVGILSLICHVCAVYDVFECMRCAANKDAEQGWTFSWLN